jgi:hypothetical protein
MQQGFPIVINLDPQLAAANKAMAAIVSKTQMWINFGALKNGWYSDESCVLEFEFMLVENNQFKPKLADLNQQDWVINHAKQYAFNHDHSHTKVAALIGVQTSEMSDFEVNLKTRLAEIANLVIKDYGFVAM